MRSWRRAFTLVETMVAASIGVIVLAAIVSAFITTQRLLRTAMVESELSLAMRELRDKLLFAVTPPLDGRRYTGLLSAVASDNQRRSTRSSFENQVRQGCVELWAPTVKDGIRDVADPAQRRSMRIRGYVKGSSRLIVNEHTPDRDRHLGWLWPGRLEFGEDDFTDLVSYAAINPNDANNPMIYRLNVDLALKVKLPGTDAEVVRRERLAVPLSGRIQQFRDRNSDNKDTY